MEVEFNGFESLDELKQYLTDWDFEETIILENPDYIEALIGVSEDGRLIYDYDLMAESLSKRDNMSIEEAYEFIDYNTIRALPYMGHFAPIILHKFMY